MAKSESELRELIEAECKRDGRKAVADRLEVTEQYISMLLNKDDPRPISAQIAARLGYKREMAVNKIFVEV